jgi:hypothetical protein
MAALRFPLDREEPERRQRSRLSLQHQRLDRLNIDDVSHELVRGLADQDRAGHCGLLEPRCHVHRVSRRQTLRRSCYDLAGVDTDPGVDAELGERISHLHCRAARA